MTTETFAEIVSVIETARGFRFTDEEHRVWFGILRPLDDQAAKQATLAALREVEGRLQPAHIWTRAKSLDDRPIRPPALPAPARPEVAEAYLAEIREQLARRRGRVTA